MIRLASSQKTYEDSGPSQNEGFKCVYDYRRIIRERGERRKDFRSAEALPLPEQYLRGHLGVIVELKRDALAQSHEAPHSVVIGLQGDVFHAQDHIAPPINGLRRADIASCDERGDGGMFVRVVQLVKLVDGSIYTHTVHRKIDEELLSVASGCFESFARGFVILPVGAGRHFGPAITLSAVKSDEFPSGMVQRATKIVCDVSNDEPKIFGHRFSEPNLDEGRAICVIVDTEGVRVTFNERMKRDFKIADVLLGPRDF